MANRTTVSGNLSDASPSIIVAGRKIRGVAFDMEGTIVDLEQFHFAAHVAIAEFLGIQLDLDDHRTFTDLIPNFIGGPGERIMEQLLALAVGNGATPTELHARVMNHLLELAVAAGTDSEQLASLMQLTTPAALDRIDHHMFINLRDGVTTADGQPLPLYLREGFLGFLTSLKKAGIPVAIGSLTPGDDAKVIFKRSGLDQLFPPGMIVLREDVENVKPAKDVYIETARRMGIPPGEQLVFEDSHNGVAAADAAGSVPVAVLVVQEERVVRDVHTNIAKRLLAKGARGVFAGWWEIGLRELRRMEPVSSNLRGVGLDF